MKPVPECVLLIVSRPSTIIMNFCHFQSSSYFVLSIHFILRREHLIGKRTSHCKPQDEPCKTKDSQPNVRGQFNLSDVSKRRLVVTRADVIPSNSSDDRRKHFSLLFHQRFDHHLRLLGFIVRTERSEISTGSPVGRQEELRLSLRMTS